jgi:hypothetical protein
LTHHRTSHPWKNRALADWFNQEAPRLEQDLREHLRNALFNRYPFILLSRDLVRYYELQMDFFARRHQNRRFAMRIEIAASPTRTSGRRWPKATSPRDVH